MRTYARSVRWTEKPSDRYNANAPTFGYMIQDDSLLLLAVLLIPPAVAILILIYLLAVAVMERGQTTPAPSGE